MRPRARLSPRQGLVSAAAIVVAVLLCLPGNATGFSSQRLRRKQHPAYDLRSLRLSDRDRASLRDLANGQQLLLFVLKTAACKVCRRQLKRLQNHRSRFKKTGTRIAALGSDPLKRLEQLRKDAKVALPIASDPTHRVLRQLGLWREAWGHPLPALILFDRCGRERGRISGRRPGMRPEEALLELSRKVAAETLPCAPMARANRPSDDAASSHALTRSWREPHQPERGCLRDGKNADETQHAYVE